MPRFVRARQKFNADQVADVDQAMADQMRKFSHIDLKGKSVAVAVGSRGIRSQPPVVRALVNELKKAGAEPFIVPGMGSHGGGTAEGQAQIVEEYNCGSQALGIPLKSSMEVVELCEVHDGMKIYCDKNAYEADFIVPVNRVKPHTSFRGRHESGLCKMMAIGLGKDTGAVEMHRQHLAPALIAGLHRHIEVGLDRPSGGRLGDLRECLASKGLCALRVALHAEGDLPCPSGSCTRRSPKQCRPQEPL